MAAKKAPAKKAPVKKASPKKVPAKKSVAKTKILAKTIVTQQPSGKFVLKKAAAGKVMTGTLYEVDQPGKTKKKKLS